MQPLQHGLPTNSYQFTENLRRFLTKAAFFYIIGSPRRFIVAGF
jgi:hypothetical protein